MKKGIFVLIAIVIGVFVLYGCHSNNASVKKDGTARRGYPAGHDMHSGTTKKNEGHPATDGFS